MQDNKFAFFTGLPRSGSTLFASILNQNPDIFVSSNSPLCEVSFQTINSFLNCVSFLANPNPEGMTKILYNLFPSYYEIHLNKKLIFDKGFTWGTKVNADNLNRIFGYMPKFVVMTRNIDDVVNSIIKLIDNNPDNIFTRYVDKNKIKDYDSKKKFLLEEATWLTESIKSTNYILENHSKNCYEVKYDELIDSPKKVIKGFYKFFDLPVYKHNLNNIVNNNQENDLIYGIPGMHVVRPTISRLK